MMSTDLTFITNENGQSLKQRFEALLSKDTRLFDCLVGYFYLNGFHSLRPALEQTEKIRILVGIQTDKKAYDLMQKAQAEAQTELPIQSHAETREQVPEAILRELEKADDSDAVEKGVHTFVEWIKSGKLEVRAYPSARLHAKLYIMTFHDGDRDMGRVVTGSSNFTEAGLQENLEFNVELKSRADYDFALKKFNDLWAVSVDVNEDYVATIEHKSPFAQFTPYELYLKFLYEYFRGELNLPDEIEDSHLPTGFKKLRYQEEAVLNARKILDEYGGVFLSDVVGLGKTFMSALLAHHLNEPCLVIAPPHLLDEHNPGSWPNVFREFGVRGHMCRSLGKLDALLEQDTSRFRTVFIDESHRFRSEGAQSYEALAQICRGKRVVLVSATPLNNHPNDILSQIKLFQPARNSNIPNVRNLEAFFGNLQRRLSGLDRRNDHDQYMLVVKENARQIREKVLKYLMIRRTRTEVEKYYGADLRAQGMKFPEVADPEPLFYKFNEVESGVFTRTIRAFSERLTYARYKQLSYYTGERSPQQVQSQVNLAKFMKILAVKRLESSFSAFQSTLSRFIRSYERVLTEFHKGHVFFSKHHIEKVFELLDADDEDGIERLLESERAERLKASDFLPSFIRDLEADLAVLNEVREDWTQIQRDPKWEAFRDILKKTPHLSSGKLILFTESRETADYLAAKIRAEVEPKTLLFTGQSHHGTREEVIANFDAKVHKPKDDYRILVATEVLAEGVNLHRSNVVVNYDIPWNPTRLIQRVGRVNRVDTKFDRIFTFNFFPTDEGNDLIKLREAAEAKIEAFIQMLGADAKLLTDGEEILTHDLFTRWNSRKAITGEDENEESELLYLTEIRSVRDKKPELFERIKRLPKKARSTRTLMDSFPVPLPGADDEESPTPALPALLTYFRQGKLDKFFLGSATAPCAELDFMTAAKLLKPMDENEPRRAIPSDFYDILDRNKETFTATTSAEAEAAGDGHGRDRNAAYILKRLNTKEIKRCVQFTEDDEVFIAGIRRLIEDGGLPKRTAKDLAGKLKDGMEEPLKVLGLLRRHIRPEILLANPSAHTFNAHSPREVILSSWMVAGN